MLKFQKQFIQLAIKANALKFGEFTLKSGRVSPYFFNAGEFKTGAALSILGKCYAQKIVDSGIEFDMLFGPAYKGIPLVAVTAAALADDHNIDVPYAFNRKEAKAHGEGGVTVGAPIDGKVLLVDDVITAGTAVRESLQLIKSLNAETVGIVIGVDRQEKSLDERSATQALEEEESIRCESIINVQSLINYLSEHTDSSDLKANLSNMQTYWQTYGVK